MAERPLSRIAERVRKARDATGDSLNPHPPVAGATGSSLSRDAGEGCSAHEPS
jgi:hypothetical protein